MRRTYLLTLAAAVMLLVSSCGPKFNWSETYSSSSKEPYGTYVVHKLLDGYNYGKFKNVDRPLNTVLQPSTAAAQSCYVFIGENLYLGKDGADSLLEFVRKGNNAFISTKQLPEELSRELRSTGCAYESYGTLTTGTPDSITNINFYHPSLADAKGYNYSYCYQNKPVNYRWYFINTANICDTGRVVSYLGYMDDHRVNFIRLPFGKGVFYIHTTPIAFTNYYLVNKRGLDYTSKVFSHLSKGDIYWDEFSRLPADEDEDHAGMPDRSPFSYILSQPPLRWALYLTLGLLLVYIMVRSKRKQRVIPILEAKENTSLQFIQTVGTLYFQQNEHRRLAMQKMKLFLQFIRHRYSIATNNISDELTKKIAMKSQVPASAVASIFEQYQWIDGQPEINETSLITFHQSIDNFYKTCK